MKMPRAIIFDVYHTLLELDSPPVDAEASWATLCTRAFGAASMSLQEFRAVTEAAIQREHAQAISIGVSYPEIYWPDIAREALPAIGSLSPDARDEFLLAHAQLRGAVRLSPERAELLRKLKVRGVLMGIISNSQPYTLRELDALLGTTGLSRALFDERLCFWSFEMGFSKPNPHAFRVVSARLQAMGIVPSETLMIGDRLDNDIAPAQAQGWQTWHLGAAESSSSGGTWNELMLYLEIP